MEAHVIILAFICEIIGTASGVSASAIFVPAASLFEPFTRVLVLTALLHVFGNTIRLVIFRKVLVWRIAIKFGTFATLGSIVGAQYSSALSEVQSKTLLGFTLMVLAVLFYRKIGEKFFTKSIMPYFGGFTSGFLTGLLGTGGAIRALAMLPFGLAPGPFVATSTLIDAVGDYLRLGIYLNKGYLDKDHFFYVVPLALAAFFGNQIGIRILGKIPSEKFNKGVLIMIFFMGVISVLSPHIKFRQ